MGVMDEKAQEAHETWKIVPGYPNYEVSDLGRVRNGSGVILKQYESRGYLRVTLCRRGTVKNLRTHRVVLLTFVGPAPDGHEGAHLNGVRSDNRLTNLEWATPKENAKHKIGHGTHHMGEQNGYAKLTEQEALEIIKLRGTDTHRNIGARFGVAERTVSNLLSGKSWAFLQTKGECQ